jgi:hypothetical protein
MCPRAGPLALFRAPPALPPHGARLLHEDPNARPLFRGDGVTFGWGDGTVSAAHGDLSYFRRARDGPLALSERCELHIKHEAPSQRTRKGSEV